MASIAAADFSFKLLRFYLNSQALYNYEALDVDELSMNVGDEIDIISEGMQNRRDTIEHSA